MKKIRKFLYLAIMAIAIAAVAVFASACGGKDDAPATKYTLKFMNGTAVYDTITATAGSTVEYKPDPTRANLVFDGWSRTENGEVEDLPEKMPAADRTYYAVFSARYQITLNAGAYGELSEDNASLTVKSGVRLYDLISGITPAAKGDAKFDAWFYNGVELNAQSATLMPTVDITLEAKYTVSYSLKEYKQLKYGEDQYGDVNSVSGTGYVGEYVTISNYVGYEYNETSDNDGDRVVTVPLSEKSSDNIYNVYYNLRAYNIIFNANMSSDVTVNGKMDNASWGYAEENTVPDCGYSVVGYRFMGWSDSASGDVKYRSGDKLSVTRATVLYAIWNKGFTDAVGQSSDYIFVIDNSEGEKEVYLRRSYLRDIKGEYNDENNTFIFKNESNQIFLRGIAYPDSETFAYLDNNAQTTYVLNERAGAIGENGYVTLEDTINSDVTLVVKENGDLVYNDGTTQHEGSLSFDHAANSMVFDGGKDCTFRFRLTTRNSGSDSVSVFEMRDETMYGVRYALDQDGSLDITTYISLDGYGGVVMYVIGYSSLVRSEDTLVVSTASGYYAKSNDADDKADVCISLFKGNYVRTTYLAFITSDKNLGNANNPVYDVYIERGFNGTVYAKPDNAGESFDWSAYIQNSETAKITLDGYGMFADSAVYTYNDEGTPKTVSGRYVIDTDVNELALVTAESELYLFLLSYVTTDEETNSSEVLFTVADETNYTSRPIIGLDDKSLNMYYRFRLLDAENAEFAFLLPTVDSFFGIYEVNLKLTVMFGGTYSEVGKDDDNNVIYEFTASAELTDAVIQYIYLNYYALFQKGLDVSYFRQFKFIKTTGYLQNGTSLDCFAATAIFSGYKDITLKYDEVTYTLDGYGTAVSADSSVSDKLYLIYDYGMTSVLYLQVQPKTESTAEVYEDYAEVTDNGVKTFKKIIAEYNTVNAKYMFRIMILEDNYAYIGYYNSSQRSFVYYSFGKLTVTDGLYEYTEISSKTCDGVPLISTYGNISFRIVTEPTGTTVGKIVIEDKLQDTLTVEGVGTLTVDKNKSQATFTATDGAVYSGNYLVHEDILNIIYTIPATGNSSATSAVKTLKLVYGTGADANKVVSFKEVGGEAGTWYSMTQDDSIMVMSGEYDGEIELDAKDENGEDIKVKVKTAGAKWTYYDNDQPVTVSGKYYLTGNTINNYYIEFCFIYTDNGEEVRNYFVVGDSTATKPVFVFREQTVYIEVYESGSSAKPIGYVYDNGYTMAQFYIQSVMQQPVTGTVTVHDEVGIVSFAVANSTAVFNFGYAPVSQTSGKWLLLDNLVSEPNFGTFTCVEGGELVLENNIKVKSVRFTGYGIALLYTDEADSDPRVVMYTTVSNTYILYTFDDNNEIELISAISLRVRNNGENAEDYVILFADKDLYDLQIKDNMFVVNNLFIDDNGSILAFDGYGSATYIDGKGVRHSVAYVKAENPVAGDTSIIVQIVYIGDNGYEVITVAIQDGKFTVMTEDDPRYPQTSEEENPAVGTEVDGSDNSEQSEELLAA